MTEEYKCEYPGCKCKGKNKQNFIVVNEYDSSVELPFCDYHFFIVMGGHFKVEIIVSENKETTFKLIGPLLEVEIAEQVLAAREMMLNRKKEKRKT